MATSSLMGSPEEPERPGGTQRGRRKKGTESMPKGKKQPQRGMGVEKLERLRHMSESAQLHHLPMTQFFVPSYPGFASYGPMGHFGFSPMGVGLAGPMGGSGFGDSSMVPKCGVIGEASRELASIPNLNQFSDHWGFSNKKRLNGECLAGIGAKRQDIRAKSRSLASYVGGIIDQEAVHRKGDSSVLKEYEFFPQQKNCSTDPKDEFLSATTTPPSNSPTTTIDLSLKLSY